MTDDAARAKRRPQERSALTRKRLVDAAITTLSEVGWSGATMGIIAERAGVSRGASQHHFRTRDDLVTAAVLHVAEVRAAEIRARKAAMARGPRKTLAVLELLSGFYLGPLFLAAVQVWVGAVSDPKLRAVVAPLEAHVGKEAHRLALELFDVAEGTEGTRETVQATLDLLRGLGLANLVTDDGARRRRVLRAWATTLDRILPPRT